LKIISPSITILQWPENTLNLIEIAARNCYQSELKNNVNFIKKIIDNQHLSVLEHCSITVKIVCDRAVMAELTRHRIGVAFSIESTRYCRYANEITVIKPIFWKEDSPQYDLWLDAMAACEDNYMMLLANGATPEQARSVLPNSLKTTIVMTANLRAWKYILALRNSKKSHPQMIEITDLLITEFHKKLKEIF